MSSSSTKRSLTRRQRRSLVIGLVVAFVAIVAIAAVARRGGEPSETVPSNDSAREADRYFVIGLSAYRQHEWRRAIQNFEAALSFDENHLDAQEHLDLSRSEDRNQQTLERAQRALEAGRAQEASALSRTIPASSVYAEQARELRREADATGD